MKRVLPLLLAFGLLTGTAHADGNAVPAAATGQMQSLPRPSKTYGWAFGGAAAGCFVLAGVLGGVALADANTQNGNVAMPPVYTAGLKSRGSQGQALADSAYAFIGIGAALTIIDAVVWYETLRKPREIGKVAAIFSPEGVRF